MSEEYRRAAERMAGPGREDLVRAVAEHHHYNESLHMHQDIGSREPCSYCWLRAGRAVQILAQRGALLDGPLAEVRAERTCQDARWGEQRHPDGTGHADDRQHADVARIVTDTQARHGDLTWRHILSEEVAEAFAEEDPAKLRAELVQVAAVAVAWVEAIDRRTAQPARAGES